MSFIVKNKWNGNFIDQKMTVQMVQGDNALMERLVGEYFLSIEHNWIKCMKLFMSSSLLQNVPQDDLALSA